MRRTTERVAFSSQILFLMGSPPHNSFKSLFSNLLHPTSRSTVLSCFIVVVPFVVVVAVVFNLKWKEKLT